MPEPGSLVLLGTGLAILGRLRHRRPRHLTPRLNVTGRPSRGQAAAPRWPHPRTRRAPAALGLLVALAVSLTAPFEAPIRAAVAFSAVAPLGASAGINVQITGTGFDPVAANNTVTLTPQGGAAVNLVAESIAVLDAAKGLRRIGITVPAGLPVGNGAYWSAIAPPTRAPAGETLQIVQITLPQTTSGRRGANRFRFGSTDRRTCNSSPAARRRPSEPASRSPPRRSCPPTSLVATVSVSATAVARSAHGQRRRRARRPCRLAAGFTVTAPNRPPAITSSAVTTAAEGKPIAYQVVATDPDGDPAHLPAGLVARRHDDRRRTRLMDAERGARRQSGRRRRSDGRPRRHRPAVVPDPVSRRARSCRRSTCSRRSSASPLSTRPGRCRSPASEPMARPSTSRRQPPARPTNPATPLSPALPPTARLPASPTARPPSPRETAH